MNDLKLVASKDLVAELMSRHPDGALFVGMFKKDEDDTVYSIRFTNKYAKEASLEYSQYVDLVELLTYARSRFDRKWEKVIEREAGEEE